jgi:hypothetical protein
MLQALGTSSKNKDRAATVVRMNCLASKRTKCVLRQGKSIWRTGEKSRDLQTSDRRKLRGLASTQSRRWDEPKVTPNKTAENENLMR